ncbi:MAG: hypothetical protein JXR53_09005 [Bacteroidales bacterium]|nr:hypothetical protein [Bacteroidales bacterium]
MNKVLFYLLIVIISQKMMYNNQIFAQNIDFQDFKSQFVQKKLPVRYIDDANVKQLKTLPINYTHWLFQNSSDTRTISPVAGFDMKYNNWLAVFFLNYSDQNNQFYLCLFNKNGVLTDSISLDYNSMMYSESNTIVEIDQWNCIHVIDEVIDRGAGWFMQGNNVANYLTFYAGRVEWSRTTYYVDESGKFASGNGPRELVSEFLLTLGSANFEEAYSFQKIKAWGSLEQFSSPNAFGGINQVVFDTMKIIYEDDVHAQVYCHAFYSDSINWGMEVSQVFYVNKTFEEPFIDDMKVISFSKQMKYSCNDFHFSEFFLKNIDEHSFEFELTIVSNEIDAEKETNKAGQISGTAKFLTSDHAVYEGDCTLHFYFKGKSMVEVKEMNCSKYRHKDLNFNGTYKFATLSF